MKLSKQELNKYGDWLSKYNPLFGVMWRRGGIVFSDEYDTAALEIADGKFRISFNPKYWRRITTNNRLFIICHEYLHVALGHWLNPTKQVDAEWLNIAQDIQVNEMLVSKHFGFVRNDIKNWKDQAWIETVFREKSDLVEKDQDAEYYYKLIMQCLPDKVA